MLVRPLVKGIINHGHFLSREICFREICFREFLMLDFRSDRRFNIAEKTWSKLERSQRKDKAARRNFGSRDPSLGHKAEE
jgi:hypothetical protein